MANSLKFLLILTASLILQGCINAAVTGAQVLYNHNEIQNTLGEHYITLRANRLLYNDTTRYRESHVTITTFGSEVLLTGQIPTQALHDEMLALVKTIPEIEHVYDMTTIAPASSSLTRLSDSWITTKVRTHLIAMNDINPDHIKVTTENGTVYLMGLVFPEEAEIAEDIANDTDGVQKVVKVFSYLKITRA